MMIRRMAPLILLALIGCSSTPPPESKEPPLTGTITLASGPCEGLCAVYSMTLNPDDTYVLNSEENTINPGRSRGSLPVNSFRRAVETLERYDFPNLDRFYTPTEPENCPDVITGLPVIDISRLDKDNDVRSFLTFNTGCVEFEDRDRLDQLQNRMREIFRVKELVSAGEPPRPPRPEPGPPVQGLGGL